MLVLLFGWGETLGTRTPCGARFFFSFFFFFLLFGFLGSYYVTTKPKKYILFKAHGTCHKGLGGTPKTVPLFPPSWDRTEVLATMLTWWRLSTFIAQPFAIAHGTSPKETMPNMRHELPQPCIHGRHLHAVRFSNWLYACS